MIGMHRMITFRIHCPIPVRYLLQSLFTLAFLAVAGAMSSASAAELNCDSASRITQTFSNGASWDLCWESRIRENLVLSDVHYTMSLTTMSHSTDSGAAIY